MNFKKKTFKANKQKKRGDRVNNNKSTRRDTIKSNNYSIKSVCWLCYCHHYEIIFHCLPFAVLGNIGCFFIIWRFHVMTRRFSEPDMLIWIFAPCNDTNFC